MLNGSIYERELDVLTGKLSGAMKNLGIKKGDRVGIYMPMVPEAIISIYSPFWRSSLKSSSSLLILSSSYEC